MTKGLFSLLVLLLTGCMEPLYQTDVPLYRQYKYWESSDKDWLNIDGFQILVYRTHLDKRTALRLVPQKKGMPATASGYIQAAQKGAFNLITADCGENNFAIDDAAAPAEGRTIDRFFYQYKDASIGITYFCRDGTPHGMDLAAEQQKWSLAERKWDSFNGIKAYVDTLPVWEDGRRQIRIRLFGGTITDNRKLARRIILNTCPNTNFRLLSEEAGVDVVPAGRFPAVVSDENVRTYDFTCTP